MAELNFVAVSAQHDDRDHHVHLRARCFLLCVRPNMIAADGRHSRDLQFVALSAVVS